MLTDAQRAEINLIALRMAVAFAACPLERCEYVVKDCVDCKVRFWRAEAERVYGEGKQDGQAR